MFEVGGGFAVGGDDGPAVGELADLGAAHVDHGFDGDRHAGFEFGFDFAAVVGDVGFFVEGAADAVADEFADDAVAVGDDEVFDGFGDVVDAVAGAGLVDADGEGFLGFGEEADGGGGDVADASLTMSAYWMRRAPPMPWTISSLTEMQMWPGKPR